MKKWNPAHTDAAQGIAVVGFIEGDEGSAFAPGRRGLPPVLKGHLEGDLNRRGTVVGIEDLVQAEGSDLDEAFRQLNGGNMGKPQERGMGDALQLGLDGLVDMRILVAMDIEPEGGVAVEETPAVEIV